jgi:succinate-semialdehyde dehydrogenase/glutarate-semialdehyde dehydrogenase
MTAIGQTQLFLAGRWEDGERGSFPVEDPALGARLCDVSDAGAGDARKALDVAARVQDRWAATPSRVRSEILSSAFEVVQERSDQLALS